MSRRLAYVLVPLALLGISGVIVSGCGQSVGEKCQIDSDCKSGLVCNEGTGLCQATNMDAPVVAGPDASDGGTPDARPIDAKPIDAMPDAN